MEACSDICFEVTTCKVFSGVSRKDPGINRRQHISECWDYIVWAWSYSLKSRLVTVEGSLYYPCLCCTCSVDKQRPIVSRDVILAPGDMICCCPVKMAVLGELVSTLAWFLGLLGTTDVLLAWFTNTPDACPFCGKKETQVRTYLQCARL